MKIAVSNIAWTPDEEPDIAKLLKSLGIDSVEIAPTKTWTEPIEATDKQILECISFWNAYDIEVAAFQSMLFSHPELKLFESEQNTEDTLRYLQSFIELAGKMGVRKMVFGSPKNRQRGDITIEQAMKVATDFFTRLGECAHANNVILCIEPNAPEYNCDFITNASEGIDFVRQVNSEGIGLHLDTACMSLAGDDMAQSIIDSKDILQHFHVSSPMLEQVEGRSDINHVAAAKALKDVGYDKLISIEMRPDTTGKNAERVERAVRFVQDTYR